MYTDLFICGKYFINDIGHQKCNLITCTNVHAVCISINLDKILTFIMYCLVSFLHITSNIMTICSVSVCIVHTVCKCMCNIGNC